jgi:hypothetical protein
VRLEGENPFFLWKESCGTIIYMAQQYTKEQYWKIYDQLPQALKEVVFSNETAEHIFTACERNGVQEMSKVAAEVGNVLMGVILPSDFQQALEKDVGLKLPVAQAVAQGINRFVFFPVKQQLEELHAVPGEKKQSQKSIGVATPRHTDNDSIQEDEANDDYIVKEEQENAPGDEAAEPVQESKPSQADQYRESLE